MNDMESQPNKPKREHSSSKSENDGSVRPPGADKHAAGGSAEPANKAGLQNKNKYGSVPPPCLKSDAEVSEWLLEAEQEDRRLAECDAERSDERRRRARRSGGRGAEDGLPESSRYPANRRWRHRGCSYQLPVSDPIPMPVIPYDPFNQLWLGQEFRRIQGNKPLVKKVPKKKKKSIQALAGDGFAVARGSLQSDDDDYDSEDDLEYNEKGEVVCPICSRMPVEVGVDVTPRGQDTAATIVTTADDTTIPVVDCPPPPADAVHDAAFVIAARTAIRKTSVDLLHEIKDHFKT